MNKRLASILLALACLMLLAGGMLALATQDYAIEWSVFASGRRVRSDNFVLSSAVGQPLAEAVVPVEYPLYLPIIKE